MCGKFSSSMLRDLISAYLERVANKLTNPLVDKTLLAIFTDEN